MQFVLGLRAEQLLHHTAFVQSVDLVRDAALAVGLHPLLEAQLDVSLGVRFLFLKGKSGLTRVSTALLCATFIVSLLNVLMLFWRATVLAISNAVIRTSSH